MDEKRIDAMFIQNVPFENFLADALHDIVREQERDAVWKDIKERLLNNDVVIRRHYTTKDHVLFFRRHVDTQIGYSAFRNRL